MSSRCSWIVVFALTFFVTSPGLLASDAFPDWDAPDDKDHGKRAVEFFEKLSTKAKELGWKIKGESKWSSQSYFANYVDDRGLQASINVRAFKPTRAFKEAKNWIGEYNRLRLANWGKQKRGVLTTEYKSYYGLDEKYPKVVRKTFNAIEGYTSPKGWAIIRGQAFHALSPAVPSKGYKAHENTFHQFYLFAEVDDLLVQGYFYLRQLTVDDETKVGDRDYNDNIICSPGAIARLNGEAIPGYSSLRQLVSLLFQGTETRNDKGIFARARGSSHKSKNVMVFGKGTEQMKALCVALQKIYDRFSVKEIAALPTKEETKRLLESFIEKANELNGALLKINKDRPEVFLISTPLQQIKGKLELAERAKRHWFNLGEMSTQRATSVNEILQKKQDTLSLNVLRSVFKNYVDWAGAIPGSPEDLLCLLGGKAGDLPWSLPRSLSGWKDNAEKDASILKKQAQSIKHLGELREFYLKRAEQAVEELKTLEKVHNQLKELYDQEFKFSNELYRFTCLKRMQN